MSIMRSNIARQLYNTGGITNLINTYQNNPTLQSQMTQQEYLDLFGSRPTSTTTEQIIKSSTSPTIKAPAIKPILPIIPQESDGDGGGGITKGFTKGYSSANFGLGPNKGVVDYEAEAYNVGPTFRGSIARVLSNLKNIPTPFTLARMGIEKAIEFTKQKQKEKEAQLAAITRDIARDNKAAGTGGYQSSFGQDTGFMEGRGTAAEMGSFKDGGIVSMFVEKK